jgi:DNA-binding GntR family transcriptional regulator
VPSYPRSSATKSAVSRTRVTARGAAVEYRIALEAAPHHFARTVAMERICSLLLDGSAPFDAPLSERAIADAIGLGRMPAREALRDLAREGILAIEPGRGTYLRQLSAREATELLEVRLAIEGMAARLAAEKGFVGDLPEVVAVLRALAKRRLAGDRVREAEAAGDRVHWQIVQGAGNETLTGLYAGLRLRIAISLRLVQRREVERIQETVGEHLAIAHAILARSPDAAAAAVHAHLSRGHALTMAKLAQAASAPVAASEATGRLPLARRRGRPPA